MILNFPPRPKCYVAILVAIGLHVFISSARAESASARQESANRWDLTDLLDQLPDLRRFDMPQFRDERFRLYARPHLGDFLHRDYLRLPVGVRVRPVERVELVSELESYFTHGFSDSAGYGLSRLRLGAKLEQILDETHTYGWSVGLDYFTPLSRPPRELSDGFRHTSAYAGLTRRILPPEWKIVGYSSVGIDLIDRSSLQPNFGGNQLHGNSLSLAVGATRQWTRFRSALTATWYTTGLITDEKHDVYALRPDFLIPLNLKEGYHTRLLLTLGARAIWGPDGFDKGLSSSVRIEFGTYRSAPPKKP